MKVSNWKRKLASALVAAGIWVPGTALATDIPLGDPSFEDYDVTGAAAGNYAYSNEYRPTSAWVDDLYSTFSYVEDDGSSNWLYDSTYDTSRRPMPRTGDQAMHTTSHYNAQVTNAVFEAGMQYTYSLWAQGDSDADGSSSRIWMYLFDASSPLSSFDAESLVVQRFAPDTGDFVNRTDGSTQAESQAMWTQISISHFVQPGAAEIGSPVGVIFWGGSDGAVDDATLSVRVPEPSTVLLVGIGGIALLTFRRRE